MARICKVNVAAGDANPEGVVLEFEDGEWALLEDTERYAADVRATVLAQKSPWQSRLTITFEKSQLKFSGEVPDWNDVIVVLHRLRPLILASERTYFYTVLNVIRRRGDHSALRGGLETIKDVYSGARLFRAVTLSVNREVLNSEAMLKQYLNAYEYHRDVDKRDKLEELFQVFPSDAMRTLLVHGLIDKMQGIHLLETLIGFLAGKQTSLDLPYKVEAQKA